MICLFHQNRQCAQRNGAQHVAWMMHGGRA